MQSTVDISWDKYLADIQKLAKQIKSKYNCILGISRGGNIPATILAEALNIPLCIIAISSYKKTKKTEVKVYNGISNSNAFFTSKKILIVDDLIDTGDTMKYLLKVIGDKKVDIAVIYNKQKEIVPEYCVENIKKGWIKFPYEVAKWKK